LGSAAPAKEEADLGWEAAVAATWVDWAVPAKEAAGWGSAAAAAAGAEVEAAGPGWGVAG
jgi:hypothetical protein